MKNKFFYIALIIIASFLVLLFFVTDLKVEVVRIYLEPTYFPLRL